MEKLNLPISGFQIKVVMNHLIKDGEAVLMLSEKDYVEYIKKAKAHDNNTEQTTTSND